MFHLLAQLADSFGRWGAFNGWYQVFVQVERCVMIGRRYIVIARHVVNIETGIGLGILVGIVPRTIRLIF
jgi:hypothetical protein